MAEKVATLVAQPGPYNAGRRKVQTITATPVTITPTTMAQVRCLELRYCPPRRVRVLLFLLFSLLSMGQIAFVAHIVSLFLALPG
jgi:hypothetical protein